MGSFPETRDAAECWRCEVRASLRPGRSRGRSGAAGRAIRTGCR